MTKTVIFYVRKFKYFRFIILNFWTKNELLEHCAGKCWCPFFHLFSGHYSPAKLLFLHTLNWAHFSSQLPSFVLLSFFSNLLMPHWTDRITILILEFRNSKDNIIRDFITFFVCSGLLSSQVWLLNCIQHFLSSVITHLSRAKRAWFWR